MLLITRRTLLKAAASLAVLRGARVDGRSAAARETLYNGIVLPTPWPPRNLTFASPSVPPPYLADPPDVVPIDVGRQLIVDDFLVEETSLTRTFHRAEYYRTNPILRPATEWERFDDSAARTGSRSNPAAMVFSDGVFYDPHDRLFKMWYMGGYAQNTCLAVSRNGIDWERPVLDVVPGTNIVTRGLRDSSTVWLDHEAADPSARLKMASFNGSQQALLFYTSADGVHWRARGASGATGDRSTMFYNPFRRRWVFSLRNLDRGTSNVRYRRYTESTGFPPPAWRDDEPALWTTADELDRRRPEYAVAPQLYNLDCVAYESVLLGLFTIFRGEAVDREKPNDLCIGFSRDGFHWWRPMRDPFIPVSDHVGDWNWANVQSAGGCCVVVGDRLHFYVSGRQGVPGTDLPGICSTGLAVLRRDGFASMTDEASGDRPIRYPMSKVRQLTTRPLRFFGRFLFVNVDVSRGRLVVEVLDRDGRVLAPFAQARANPVERVDRTQARITWAERQTLEDLAGEPVRFRFTLNGGHLYAFWVSSSERGSSRGYVAAGGPGFSGATDV